MKVVKQMKKKKKLMVNTRDTRKKWRDGQAT